MIKRAGADSIARIVSTPQRHGDLHSGDRAPRIKRHGAELEASGSRPKARLDSSGPGEGATGDRCATQRHGIESFRWRDLRHTWASWHVQNGTPLFALQELAGWETEKMVRRYAAMRTLLLCCGSPRGVCPQ